MLRHRISDTHWLQRSSLPTPVIQQSLRIIAILIAVQWPLTFYQGGLLGLQRHPSLNVIRVAMTAAAAAGGYWVVTHVSPAVTAFFIWQSIISLAHVGLVTWLLWRSLPASKRRPRIRLSAVQHVGRFAAGITIITITALILTQLDRVVLSRLVSLEQFGYYVVAGLLGNGLYALIGPMFMSIFPRFSTLAASGDDSLLDHTYRRAWQLMMALIVPVAAVVAVFSSELLLLWTRDSVVARVAGPIAAFLVVGTALNGLMNVPYALQLARGWTSLGVKVNLMLTLLACPAIVVAAQRHGPLGAVGCLAGAHGALHACGAADYAPNVVARYRHALVPPGRHRSRFGIHSCSWVVPIRAAEHERHEVADCRAHDRMDLRGFGPHVVERWLAERPDAVCTQVCGLRPQPIVGVELVMVRAVER